MTEVKSVDPNHDFEKVVQQFEHEVKELYKFRDFFFENHPIEMATEKEKLLKAKVAEISEKFDLVNESEIPMNLRARYLYIKGSCYNAVTQYDPRALECFSKAVKLSPDMIEAWNELGDSYWKNMNIKESQACLEGSLKRQRHRVTLRRLSILLRQSAATNSTEAKDDIIRSVEYAKEAVSMDPKDGVSWSVLGNAYLCQYFAVEQLSSTLKLAMSAYKQAWNDAIARGTPDLAYNKGIAANYDENYEEALECFELAHQLEPSFSSPTNQAKRLTEYLQYVDDIVQHKGRIKIKRLQQMVKSIVDKFYGEYAPGTQCTVNNQPASRQRVLIRDLLDGPNKGTVTIGRVIGSYHSENAVPFTFAIIDDSMSCLAVNVYNWANGRGVIIGDCVCIPDPNVSTHTQINKDPKYNFRSIRVNNPLSILINGKRPGRNQYAGTKVSTTLGAC